MKEIEFVCDSGYTLIGTHRILCGANGQWDQQPPRCRPKIVCNEPGNLTNGVRRVSEDVDGMFAPGTQIKFSCNKNYFLDGIATITCTTTGKWSSSLPKCLKGKTLGSFFSSRSSCCFLNVYVILMQPRIKLSFNAFS